MQAVLGKFLKLSSIHQQQDRSIFLGNWMIVCPGMVDMFVIS